MGLIYAKRTSSYSRDGIMQVSNCINPVLQITVLHVSGNDLCKIEIPSSQCRLTRSSRSLAEYPAPPTKISSVQEGGQARDQSSRWSFGSHSFIKGIVCISGNRTQYTIALIQQRRCQLPFFNNLIDLTIILQLPIQTNPCQLTIAYTQPLTQVIDNTGYSVGLTLVS